MRTNLFKTFVPRGSTKILPPAVCSHLFDSIIGMLISSRSFYYSNSTRTLLGSSLKGMIISSSRACCNSFSNTTKVSVRGDPCLFNYSTANKDVSLLQRLSEASKRKEHLLLRFSCSHKGQQSMTNIMLSRGKGNKVRSIISSTETLRNDMMLLGYVRANSLLSSVNNLIVN